jgi:hypothetical protein
LPSFSRPFPHFRTFHLVFQLPTAGIRVYDPGYNNTAVIQSRITFIDGERGILRHRGYPIEQLAEQSTFLETAYLLLYGELPTKGQSDLFTHEVLHHSYVHRDLERIVGNFRFDAHPMYVLPSSRSLPPRLTPLSAIGPSSRPVLRLSVPMLPKQTRPSSGRSASPPAPTPLSPFSTSRSSASSVRASPSRRCRIGCEAEGISSRRQRVRPTPSRSCI